MTRSAKTKILDLMIAELTKRGYTITFGGPFWGSVNRCDGSGYEHRFDDIGELFDYVKHLPDLKGGDKDDE